MSGDLDDSCIDGIDTHMRCRNRLAEEALIDEHPDELLPVTASRLK